MKFGLTHRVLTSALAALGVLAIVLSGALPRASTILLLIGLVLAVLATERFQQSAAARYAAAIVPSVLLGVEFLRLIGGANLLDLAVEFAAALQIVRLGTRRGAMHDQQVILLALLHLVAGTVLGGGIAYGLCLVGFLVLAPGALVLSHLRREVEGNYRQGARDRTGLPVDVPRILRSRRVIGPGFLALTCLLSLPIIVFTTLLFILFPRVGLQMLLLQSQRSNRLIGFSEHVDLAQVGKLREDPTVILRFRPQNADQKLPEKRIIRLRGTAFDEYQGGGQWSRSTNERVPLQRFGADVTLVRAPAPGDEHLKIELEPLDPTVLFMPVRTVAMRWTNGLDMGAQRPPPLVRGPESTFRYEASPDRVLRYEVWIAPNTEAREEPLTPRDRERYLQLPKQFPPRIKELAQQWTAGATTDEERASAIKKHLETEYRYSLETSSGGTPNPIDHFLFESREGHCEFFSTAMVLMLRTVGVPARNVTGYVGGTLNRFSGFYAVRQGDAHSWVEAYVDRGSGKGAWDTFDPTPASGAQPIANRSGIWTILREAFEAVSQNWDNYVVNYDFQKQYSLFDRWRRAIERAKKSKTGAPDAATAPTNKKRAVGGAVVVLLAAGATFYFWRRRRGPGPTDQTAAARVRDQRIATELWLSLEEALATRGATRPRNVPPVRFTEQLLATRKDALAEEAYALACRYADARFGGHPFTPDEQREFARRVAQLRRGEDAPPSRAA